MGDPRRHVDSTAPFDDAQELNSHDVLYEPRDHDGQEEEDRLLSRSGGRRVQKGESHPPRSLFGGAQPDGDQYHELSLNQYDEGQGSKEAAHYDENDEDDPTAAVAASTKRTSQRLTASERNASKRRKKFYKEIISIILPMILLSPRKHAGRDDCRQSQGARRSVDWPPRDLTPKGMLTSAPSTQFWEVFQVVPELFILVPIMLNLKGRSAPDQHQVQPDPTMVPVLGAVCPVARAG